MIKSRLVLLSILSALLLMSSAESYAKSEKPVKLAGSSLDIVAVVGERAISSFDLESRIKFIVATTHITNSPDVIAGLKPQIIRTLVDESLQLQEAEKNNIKIDDKEVAQAIAGIEAQRGMPAGGIASMLAANNVPAKTFNDQIRAQISWGKLLTKTTRPKIKISDEEVTLAVGHTNTDTQAKPEVAIKVRELQIAVINLPIEKASRVAEVNKLSNRLYGELQKGARFEEVARQFSAGGDGKAFWISPGQLEAGVAKVLSTTKMGSITPPIPTRDGFSIIKLVNIKADKPAVKEAAKIDKDNKKDVEVSMKEILLKLKPTASQKDADVLLQIGQEVAKNPGTCEEKGVAGVADLNDFDIEVNMQKAPYSDLPPALRTISDSLKQGEISTPFASAEGIRLYMMCGKKELGADSSYAKDKVREVLFRQKFELEAQKYLRDLRREAFVEVRA